MISDNHNALQNQILGCLLGGAIGDMLGVPYEGWRPFDRQLTKKSSDLSDDTQLTLATCEAIIEKGVVDPASIARSMALWFAQGRVTGYGASTYKALSQIAAGDHWALSGRKGDHAAGNGAAMRIAPLAFFLDPTDPEHREIIRYVSRITHHNEEAYSGAMAVLAAVRAAYRGEWNGGNDIFELVVDHLPDSNVRDRLSLFSDLLPTRSIAEIAQTFGTSGYVVHSIPLALFAAQKVNDIGFPDVLVQIIQCGGDADTNAAIAGQIMGALLGARELPEEWITRLPAEFDFKSIANKLAIIASRPNP